MEGGEYGTPIQAAIYAGCYGVVQKLLSKGVRLNTCCGTYGNPLQAAAYGGALQIFKLLLECGADANLEGGDYGFALQAATASPRKVSLSILSLLLDHGANINANGGQFVDVLQAACVRTFWSSRTRGQDTGGLRRVVFSTSCSLTERT